MTLNESYQGLVEPLRFFKLRRVAAFLKNFDLNVSEIALILFSRFDWWIDIVVTTKGQENGRADRCCNTFHIEVGKHLSPEQVKSDIVRDNITPEWSRVKKWV